MVFPIGDDNSDRLTPYVNYLLLALNIPGFVLFEQFTYAWATVPQEIVTGADIARRQREGFAWQATQK